MRIFQTKLFDGFVSGTASVYTHTAFSDLLGSVERLTFGATVSAVTGTFPTLSVQLESSPDGTRWMNQSGGPELDPTIQGMLVAGDNPAIISSNQSSRTVPIGGLVRMRIALGGTSPAGYVRLWVAGRSPAF